MMSAGATKSGPRRPRSCIQSVIRGRSPNQLVLRPRTGLVQNFLLVALEDVVEVLLDREDLALGGELLRRHVDEELVPGLVVELRLDVLGVDPRIPVELLHDA